MCVAAMTGRWRFGAVAFVRAARAAWSISLRTQRSLRRRTVDTSHVQVATQRPAALPSGARPTCTRTGCRPRALSRRGVRRRGERRRSLGNAAITFAVVLLLWQAIVSFSGISPFVAKGPVDVWNYLVTDPDAAEHRAALMPLVWQTLLDSGIGFIFGMLTAIVLAVLFSLSRPSRPVSCRSCRCCAPSPSSRSLR